MKDFVRPEGEAILLCTHYSLNIVKVRLNFYIFTKVFSSESLCLRNYLVLETLWGTKIVTLSHYLVLYHYWLTNN